jgi:hypothetical protein
MLGHALLLDRVVPAMRRLAESPPSLPLVFVRTFSETHLRPGRTVEVREGRAVLLNVDGEVIAETPAALDPRALLVLKQGGARALRGVNGQRFVRHIVKTTYEQHVRAVANPATIRFIGGKEGVFAALGMNTKRGYVELDAILEAGQHFSRSWLGGDGRVTRKVGGLWTYEHTYETTRNRTALLEVTAANVLRPGQVFCGALPRGETWLEPVLSMPAPYGKNPAAWGPQAAFQMEIPGILLEHRLELFREGGARVAPEEWRRAARAVGLEDDSASPAGGGTSRSAPATGRLGTT